MERRGCAYCPQTMYERNRYDTRNKSLAYALVLLDTELVLPRSVARLLNLATSRFIAELLKPGPGPFNPSSQRHPKELHFPHGPWLTPTLDSGANGLLTTGRS